MDPRLTLLIAVAALGVGPALAGLLLRQGRMRAWLDGFVLVMVAGLCLRSLLPHAYEALGAIAFLVALAGFFLPHLAESRLQHHRHGESPAVLGAAALGLMMHAALDGTTLAVGMGLHGTSATDPGVSLPLAIVLHRLPVGLFIWWSVRPKLGARWAGGLLAALGVSTIVGFQVSSALADVESGSVGGVLHALLAGGLLHVILDHPGPQQREVRASGAVGAILAVVIFAFLPERHNAVIAQALRSTWGLLLESSGAILLGFLGAGLLAMVPAETMARLMTGSNAWRSALRGIVFGLPLPVCSCGVVPLYRSLMHKGVPAAAAMAFLVATPELGMDSILISVPLLGWKLAIVRIVLAFAVALIVGLVAGWLVGPPKSLPPGSASMPTGVHGFRKALRYGFVEMVDDLGPWILAGLLVAGFLEGMLTPALAEGLPRLLEVPLFAALGTPLYICASGATPVAAVLLAKGISVGAVLALLISGPATNITTLGAVRASHGLRTTLLLVLTVPVSTIVLGMALNAVGIDHMVRPPVEHEHAPPTWQILTAVAFGLLVLSSFFRQGPRGFLRQLGVGDEDDHDHGHEDVSTTGAPLPQPSGTR